MKHTLTIPSQPIVAGPIVLCLGFFDGIHRGHQALISEAVRLAACHHATPVLLTFDPHPSVVLGRQNKETLLSSVDDRDALASRYGIDHLAVLPFTLEVAHLSPDAFIRSIVLPLNPIGVVCGDDFRFGDRGAGNALMLTTYPLGEVRIINPILDHDERISSTRVLKTIQQGDMAEATRLLGHPYQVKGMVIPGRAIGRTIGFPTANIRLSYHYRMPKEGVYFGWIQIQDRWHQAVMNYGYRPSIDDNLTPLLEVHVLNFKGELVGEVVAVIISEHHRSEMKFASLDQLKAQIANDVQAAQRYFVAHPNVPL